jgi:acyl carrier protein
MTETTRGGAPPGDSAGGSDAAILAGVAEVARRYLGWEGPLAPELRLVEDLRLDSIRLLTLAVEVENRFRVRLDQADEEGIATVGDLVATVGRKLAGGGAEEPE